VLLSLISHYTDFTAHVRIRYRADKRNKIWTRKGKERGNEKKKRKKEVREENE
jgi:hypothetical protein